MKQKHYLILGIVVVVVIVAVILVGRYGITETSLLTQNPVVINTETSGVASSPMDLILSATQFSDDKTSEITVRVGKRVGYKAEWFEANNTKAEIQLPEGLELIEGNSIWTGDISSEEVAEFKVKVRAVENGEWVVRANAISDEFPAYESVGDTERFYILVKDDQVLIGDRSFTPTPTPSGEEIIKKVGERGSYFVIQKINPDSVEGLWYAAYPIPTPVGTPRTLRIGDDIGYACEGVSEKLISIDFSGQSVTFTKVVGEPPFGGCPICLSSNTLIDTPSGLIPVKDLQVGMTVWTTDKAGSRTHGVIEEISKVSVPAAHKMVHLIFGDGREVFVSPGHKTTDGRTTGDLTAGDFYDGAYVVTVDRVMYNDTATYDILPSGETGFYWANGILLDSTLH